MGFYPPTVKGQHLSVLDFFGAGTVVGAGEDVAARVADTVTEKKIAAAAGERVAAPVAERTIPADVRRLASPASRGLVENTIKPIANDAFVRRGVAVAGVAAVTGVAAGHIIDVYQSGEAAKIRESGVAQANTTNAGAAASHQYLSDVDALYNSPGVLRRPADQVGQAFDTSVQPQSNPGTSAGTPKPAAPPGAQTLDSLTKTIIVAGLVLVGGLVAISAVKK